MQPQNRARSSARLERQAHNLCLEERPVGRGFKSLRAHHTFNFFRIHNFYVKNENFNEVIKGMVGGKVKALVVGGAGFVGYRLVKRLLAEGHSVRVLDVKPGRLKRLPSSNLKLVLGSMTERQVVQRVMKGVDVVYHMALIGGFSIRNLKLFNANLQGTLNLLRAAKSQKVKQFIFTSSTAVYGKR